MWIGSVNNMDAARELIRENASKERAQFLVWAQETQTKYVYLYHANNDEIVLVNEAPGAQALS